MEVLTVFVQITFVSFGGLAIEHIEYIFIVPIYGLYSVADEPLPALANVAVAFVVLNSKHGVQHKYALLGPTGQIAMQGIGHLEIDVYVFIE